MPQLIIEDPEIIEKILRHLKLWDLPARPPPARPSVTLETDPDFLAWEGSDLQAETATGS